MSGKQAILHMLCGKIASGKSTLAAQLADAPDTVMLSEDHLLSSLYPGEINSLEDYVNCHRRLRTAISPHVRDLLRAGLSVVMDFQANTPKTRAWMRSLFEEVGAAHQLHLITVSDDICRARLKERNAGGAHEYQVSEEDFDLFNDHFIAPAEDEGFTIVRHD